MFRTIERAVFSAITAGSIAVIGVTVFLSNPNIVLASAPDTPAGVMEVVENKSSVEIPVLDVNLFQEEPEIAENPAVIPNPVIETDVDGCSVSPSYPENVRRWCGFLETYSAETGLDANFLAAVMLQESGGHPDAYSHSGAVGLMQVMPRDGLAAGFMCPLGPCFANRPSMNELYDPEFNIAFGSQMLAGLLNKHGSLREALAAYGPVGVGYTYADKVLAIYEGNR